MPVRAVCKPHSPDLKKRRVRGCIPGSRPVRCDGADPGGYNSKGSLKVKISTQNWLNCFVRAYFLGKTQNRHLDCDGALRSSYLPKCLEQVTSEKKEKICIPCIEEFVQWGCMGLV